VVFEVSCVGTVCLHAHNLTEIAVWLTRAKSEVSWLGNDSRHGTQKIITHPRRLAPLLNQKQPVREHMPSHQSDDLNQTDWQWAVKT